MEPTNNQDPVFHPALRPTRPTDLGRADREIERQICQDGCEEAFENYIRRKRAPWMVSVQRSIPENEHVACEDIVGDLVAVLCEQFSRGDLRKVANLAAWCQRILSNLISGRIGRKILDRAHTVDVSASDEAEICNSLGAQTSRLATGLDVEVQDFVEDLVRYADEEARRILLIRFSEGHISDQEISRRLGITRRMVQIRRQALKDAFRSLEQHSTPQKRARGRPKLTV